MGHSHPLNTHAPSSTPEDPGQDKETGGLTLPPLPFPQKFLHLVPSQNGSMRDLRSTAAPHSQPFACPCTPPCFTA